VTLTRERKHRYPFAVSMRSTIVLIGLVASTIMAPNLRIARRSALRAPVACQRKFIAELPVAISEFCTSSPRRCQPASPITCATRTMSAAVISELKTRSEALEGPRRSLADLKALAANITRFATPPGCARGPG
jgi:hypothetical protein